MIVFLIYRQPTYYDSYIMNNENEPDDNTHNKSDCKFEILSRTPTTYA